MAAPTLGSSLRLSDPLRSPAQERWRRFSMSPTPVARHGGRAPHALACAYTRVDDL